MLRRSKNKFILLYAIVLFAFTAYAVLDTFVISSVYTPVVAAESVQTESVSAVGTEAETTDDRIVEDEDVSTSDAAVVTSDSYSYNGTTITLTTYRENDTNTYVADVVLSSADQLKTALAENAYGKNVTEKTSEMAESNNAVLAINGDYNGTQESGYVIRNGVLYRDEAEEGQEDLVIWSDGSFSIINESDVTAEELLEQGAMQVLSFGPGLIENGTVTVDEDDEVGKAMSSNPRTAIGIIEDLHYVFVVSDGRTDESEGLTLLEMAEFMESLGVETAYNLDGGGSSTMVFNGELINNPTTNGNKVKERGVSDIVYIG